MAVADARAEVGPASITDRWRRPPGWRFHLALVPPTLGLLWAHSIPGLDVLPWIASLWLLAAGATVWLVRALAHVAARRRRPPGGRPAWFLVAPAAALAVAALVVAEAPLRSRWALSRPDFEAALERLERDGASVDDERVGLYRVASTERRDGATLFHEARGGFVFDVTGFAHLPDGPAALRAATTFEEVELRHLGGDWYAWIGSS